MPRFARSVACRVLLVGVTLAPPGTVTAQQPYAPIPAPGVHVAERPGETLIAVAVVVPVGSADDPQDVPGAARLVAESVAESVRRRIDPDASQLDAQVERAWTAFTLLSTADAWRRSWEALEDALFRRPLDPAPVEAARNRLEAAFAFEADAPAHEFHRELYRTLVGTAHPWSRDPRGTASALRSAERALLADFRARHYVAARATAALVGPVTERAARDALEPVGTEPVLRSESAGPAWDVGDRLALQREVTNTWIGAAFPAPPRSPRTHLEFVALQLQEDLNPSPPDPGLYSATVHIEDTPRGPVVMVQTAVVPENAARWEQRIIGALGRLENEADAEFFQWQRRRFRSAILLREGTPEEAALRRALDLLREGRVRALEEEVRAIGPRDLAVAAEGLGEGRVLVMGPDLPGL